MTSPPILEQEFSPHGAVPFAPIPGAVMFRSSTPAHEFWTVVAPIHEGMHCVVLPSRDVFDECLANAVLAFVATRSSLLSVARSLLLLEGFSSPPYSFDVVAVLGPAAARQFECENEPVGERAFVAFPAFRCELCGDETPAILDIMRHDFLPSLDWKRSPCPKIAMAFRNTRYRTGSRRRLTNSSTLQSELGELQGAEGSWIEVVNFAGNRCRIEWACGQYMIGFSGDAPVRSSKENVIARVMQFVTRDRQDPTD